MTSCGGTLSVIVRRSTFTSWSTIGIFQTSPGPRGGSSSRPKRNMTARREHAVRRGMEVDDQQRDSEQHEREPSPARRQHREPVQGQHETDGAERAGQHDSGVEHLEDEPDYPEQEQQADQVRVDDRVEETREEARLDRVDLRSREMQR